MMAFRLIGLPLLAGAALYLLQWLLTVRHPRLRFLLPLLALIGWIIAVRTGWRNNREGFDLLLFLFFLPWGLTALLGLWRGTRRGMRHHDPVRIVKEKRKKS